MKSRFVFVFCILFVFSALAFSAAAIELNNRFKVDKSFLSSDSEFRNPELVFTNKGDIALSWIKTAPLRTGSTVYAQLFDFSGNPKSNVTALTDDLLPKYNQIAGFNDLTENIVIAWQEGKSAQQIKLSSFTNELRLMKHMSKVGASGFTQLKPSLSVSPGGNYAFAWQDVIRKGDSEDNNAAMAIYDREFHMISRGDINIATGNPQQTDPSVVMMNDRLVTSVYSLSSSPISYGIDIMGKTVDLSGNYTAEFPVISAVGDQFNPIAFKADPENIIVLWEQTEDGFSNLYGTKVSYNGTISRERFIVAKNKEHETGLSVAADDAGNFIAVWQENDPTAGSRIKARMFDSNGNSLGNVFEVSDSVNENTKPSVSLYGDKIAFAYESYDGFNRNVIVVTAFKTAAAKQIAEKKAAEAVKPNEDVVQQQESSQGFFAKIMVFLKRIFRF